MRAHIHSSTPLIRIVPHREIHLLSQWAGSHARPCPIQHTRHTDRAPQGQRSQWEGSQGGPLTILAHPSRGPYLVRSFTYGNSGKFASARAQFGTPLTRIVPHRALHLRPLLAKSHAGPSPISANASHGSIPAGNSTYGSIRKTCMRASARSSTPSRRSCPIGTSTYSPSGQVRVRARACAGALHAQIAPRRLLIYGTNWRPRDHLGTPLTRIVHHRPYLRPRRESSRAAPSPFLSECPSHGSCPMKFPLQPHHAVDEFGQFQHTLHMDRAHS